jgi:DNA-binding NtrC family response regulator
VEHALHLAGRSRVILPQHLPASVRAERFDSSGRIEDGKFVMGGQSSSAATEKQKSAVNTLILPNANGELPSLKQIQEQAAAKAVSVYLVELMQLTDGDIQEACAIAQLSRSRLYKYLQEHNIRRSGWQSSNTDK